MSYLPEMGNTNFTKTLIVIHACNQGQTLEYILNNKLFNQNLGGKDFRSNFYHTY